MNIASYIDLNCLNKYVLVTVPNKPRSVQNCLIYTMAGPGCCLIENDTLAELIKVELYARGIPIVDENVFYELFHSKVEDQMDDAASKRQKPDFGTLTSLDNSIFPRLTDS